MGHLSTMRPLYTIGHSTRSVAELIEALRAWNVESLVDIRHFRRSRRNPQFNEDVLAAELSHAGISYLALPGLGGRRGRAKGSLSQNTGWHHPAFRNYADYAATETFAEAFAVLVGQAARSTCAVMCAEAVWWRCHRRIVADYAIARGIPVVHIFTASKADPAVQTSFARIDDVTPDRVTIHYPAPPPVE
jgi:uncharacterized protein (DUF488 family)